MAARPGAREKVERDDGIVRDRARGLTWRVVAERAGISERHCREVWRQHLDSAVPITKPDLTEELQETLAQVDAVIQDLAVLADAANESVRLGAIKARQAAIAERVALKRAMGLLPRLEVWRDCVDLAATMAAIVEALKLHGVPDETQLKVADTLGEAVSRANGHPVH